MLYFYQIIAKDNDFIEYLEKRLLLYSNPNVNVEDEIDFLGYCLDTGELGDKKALQKVTRYKLNKTSYDIDSYFQSGGKKPIKKR